MIESWVAVVIAAGTFIFGGLAGSVVGALIRGRRM